MRMDKCPKKKKNNNKNIIREQLLLYYYRQDRNETFVLKRNGA